MAQTSMEGFATKASAGASAEVQQKIQRIPFAGMMGLFFLVAFSLP